MRKGVYILQLRSGHFYIGQTGNWSNRRSSHKFMLKTGQHSNQKLRKNYTSGEEVEVTLIETETVQQAQELEKTLIHAWWGNPLLCNVDRPDDHNAFLRGVEKSEEHKAKLSVSLLGHVVSEETKAKISMSSKGRITSEETRRKLSAATIGRKRPPELMARIAATKSKKVIVDGVVYSSTTEAGKQLGVAQSTVGYRCRNTDTKFDSWRFYDSAE